MLSLLGKSTAASSLIAVLVLSSGVSTRTLEYRLQCLRDVNGQIMDLSSCGHKGSIAYCLGNLQPTARDSLLQQVETCYLNAGCDEAESKLEAVRTLAECDQAEDLRKRQGAKATDAETETEAATADKPATTTKSGPKTTLVAGTTEEAKTTEKATTSPTKAAATTSSPSTSTDSPTPSSTTSSSSTTATSQATTTTAAPGLGLAHSGRPLVCFTTSLHSTTTCPIQSTGSQKGHALSCFPTAVPTSVCAEGLICQQDDDGNGTCMYAYTKFDAAGVVIAIFFAVAVTAAVALIATLCCREKRAHKRAAAAAIAAEARRMAGKAGTTGVRVGVEEVGDGAEEGRGLMGGREEGPFGDQHRVR